MTAPHPLDTPIDRASIAQMPIADLEAMVAHLHVQRLKAYSVYQAGLEAKQKKAEDKNIVLLEKSLNQFPEQYERVEKAIAKLEKIVATIQVARVVAGDDITK